MNEVGAAPEVDLAEPVPLAAQALRIVLFGLPESGKSSLLSALYRLSEGQSTALAGRIIDVTGKLATLHKAVENGFAVDHDVIAIPIVYEAADGDESDRVEAILFDCNGRAATALVNRQRLDPHGPGRELVQAILQADALILTMDISSSKEALENNFRQFVGFLRALELSRSRHNEVNGLPVYLVLTKCDLLAKSGDSFAEWIDRIEERKKQIASAFLKHLRSTPSNPFGRVSLAVRAAASRRPELASVRSRRAEPFQIGELFRECLKSAESFRRQRRIAERRLRTAFVGVGLIAGIMALLAVLFLLTRQGVGPAQLEKQINSYFDHPIAQSAARLDQWEEKLKRLRYFESSPYFSGVSIGAQERVKAEIAELEAYRDYSQALERILSRYGYPEEILSEDRLEKYMKQLEEIRPPNAYAGKWDEAKKVQEHRRWLQDAKAIAKAVQLTKQKYETILGEANDLLDRYEKGDVLVNEAKKKADAILTKAGSLLPKWDTIADTYIPDSKRISWETIGRIESVVRLRRRWENLEPQIRKILR